MGSGKKWPALGFGVPLVVLLDQATKLHIHARFTLHESRPIIDHFFDLTYVRNSGAAFGFLARRNPDFLRWFFPVMTVLALVALVVYFVRLPSGQPLTRWGLCLIMGGALGNGIDRLWLGQVIDFLDVHWYNAYHWPAFNVADSAICIGVGCLFLDAFRAAHQPQAAD